MKAQAATLAMVMAATFVILLAILHVVRADLDPRLHMISEYGVGSSRWLMSTAFFALAAALFSLMLVFLGSAQGWLGLSSVVLLGMAGIGAAMGGLFPMDPMGTLPEHFSTSGKLHGVAFMIGTPGTLLGVTLLTAYLWRDPDWNSAHSMLLATAALVWLTAIVFGASMAILLRKRAAGPDFVVGWQNRALVLAWAVWVFALAWRIRFVSRLI
jgi:hypothetical protein